MNEKIASRHQSFDLFTNGHFGNTVPSWTFEEFAKQEMPGLFSVRYRGGIGGSGPCEYKQNWSQGMLVAFSSGLPVENFFFNQDCPDNRIALQGEVLRDVRGLYLFYSTEKVPMREGLRRSGRHVWGLSANMLLKRHCDPSSLEDIRWLLDEYDGATLEFSTWECSYGTLPGRNTVVWEVRHY